MIKHSSTLPPEPQPNRERIFSMRLTVTERRAIETLAKHLNMPDSRLARHFVLEAVAFQSQPVWSKNLSCFEMTCFLGKECEMMKYL